MPHISYSELKNWEQCSYKHKLINIDKINNFTGNEYTAFGTALHSVCESLLTENKGKDVDEGELFVQEFRKEINEMKAQKTGESPSLRSLKNLEEEFQKLKTTTKLKNAPLPPAPGEAW